MIMIFYLLPYPMILPGKPWIATFTCRNITVNRKADNDSISMQWNFVNVNIAWCYAMTISHFDYCVKTPRAQKVFKPPFNFVVIAMNVNKKLQDDIMQLLSLFKLGPWKYNLNIS